MPFLKKVNNAFSTIDQVGGISALDLSVTIANASKFPTSGDFLITTWNATTYPDPSDDPNQEILKVTSVAGNTFTIERGQENTIAHYHANGQAVQMLITAGHFEEIENAITVLQSDEVIGENLTSQNDGLTNSFTTAFDYEPGTLQIYYGGLRQAETFEIVETGNNTFDFVTTPISGLPVIVDYEKLNSSTADNIYGENLTSQVDGVNVDFTTNSNYKSGTLKVFFNGARFAVGVGTDIIETGSNTFQFLIAPEAGAKVIVDYTLE